MRKRRNLGQSKTPSWK